MTTVEGEHQNKYELLRNSGLFEDLGILSGFEPQCKVGMSFVINRAAPLALISRRFREIADGPEEDILIELSLPSQKLSGASL